MKYCIHTATQAEYDTVVSYYEQKGMRGFARNRYTEYTSRTCISPDEDGQIRFSPKAYYEEYRYTIIPFANWQALTGARQTVTVPVADGLTGTLDYTAKTLTVRGVVISFDTINTLQTQIQA